jgi:hypothetical protein
LQGDLGLQPANGHNLQYVFSPSFVPVSSFCASGSSPLTAA